MKRRSIVFLLSLLSLLIPSVTSYASLEMSLLRTLKMEKTPRDVAISVNGKWIYVLTDQGDILVYSADGRLSGKASVGKSPDRIEAGPREDMLFITSRAEKTVKVISLEFTWDINITGSPFKGRADAPVVIIVFSEFQ